MLGGNVVQTLVMGSDGVGLASATLSIGNDPALAGKTLYMQSFWLWTGCKTGSPFGYSSSRGLEVKISW
jgi:hypothetical protein